MGKNVELTFITESENNASHFTIQHATDGNDFREIGTLSAHGTTSEPHSYQFTHEAPSPGDNYYRLMQVDYDGKFEYSKIVQVQIGKAENGIAILPNPTNGAIRMFFDEPTSEAYEVCLFDLDGKIIRREILPEEISEWTIREGGLPAGIYFLKVLKDGIPIWAEKLVKQ